MPKQYIVYKALNGQESDPDQHRILTKPTPSLVLAQKQRKRYDTELSRKEGDGKWFVGIKSYEKPSSVQRAWVYDQYGRAQGRPMTVAEAQTLVNKNEDWTYHVINPVPDMQEEAEEI